MNTSNEMMARVQVIVDTMSALLGGEEPQVQGAVIGELLSILMLGYIVPDDPAETRRVRQGVFDATVKLAWKMVEVGDAERMISEAIATRQ